MKKETVRTLGMAGGIIRLAGIAAWMGLAHGCEQSQGSGVIAGHVTIDPQLASKVSPTDVLFVIVRRPERAPSVRRQTNRSSAVSCGIRDQEQRYDDRRVRT